MCDTEKKDKKKKGGEDYIPSDRMILYTPVDILEKLAEMAKEQGVKTKNQMALLIIKERLGVDI